MINNIIYINIGKIISKMCPKKMLPKAISFYVVVEDIDLRS